MKDRNLLSGKRLNRIVLFLSALLAVLGMAACGGTSNPTTPPVANVKNAAFVSNTFSGALQIVDTQNDTTSFTAQSTNSSGQLIQGQPVSIPVSTTVTFELLSPDKSKTLVYDPLNFTLYVVTNSSQTVTSTLSNVAAASMALFSPDNGTVYVPVPSAPVSGQRAGLVQVWTLSNGLNAVNYTVPAARYIALSPNGQYLLVFSDNSDSIILIDTTASTVQYVSIPGFARPINAFFTADNNTAYVLNCGPECGSSGPASVARLDIPSRTITATVPVGGASVGLLNGTTLYVAGSPVPPGTTSTYDAVNIGNMTRITANSVAIGDGFHTTMALAQNNKLYIGANSCTNTTTGCLSVVDVSTNTADPPLPPRGAITSLLAISNRDVVYAVEGGFLHIYDTTNDTLQPTQIIFTGALYGIVQVN
jgi:hypothetical protein